MVDAIRAGAAATCHKVRGGLRPTSALNGLGPKSLDVQGEADQNKATPSRPEKVERHLITSLLLLCSNPRERGKASSVSLDKSQATPGRTFLHQERILFPTSVLSFFLSRVSPLFAPMERWNFHHLIQCRECSGRENASLYVVPGKCLRLSTAPRRTNARTLSSDSHSVNLGGRVAVFLQHAGTPPAIPTPNNIILC